MLPLVIVGDSYARGVGASSRDNAYPSVLAELLHCPVRTVAAGGAGFVNPGRHKGTHARRRWRVPARRSLLLIQSSANDRGWDRDDIAEAMSRYLAGLRGDSPVVVTSAIWSGPNDRDRLAVVSAAARSVAADRGLTFIDADGWITEETEADLFHDGHPNDAGHRLIGVRLAAALRGHAVLGEVVDSRPAEL